MGPPRVSGVDLDIAVSDAVLVVGGNGSGKSTLAWLLAGLLTPTEGEALLDDQPIVEQVGRVGLCFQHVRLQLLRHTVAGELDGTGRGLGSASEALALVGLPPRLAASAIDDLSGGQQRRVALARLLASESPLLVLDEPLAGLDDEARGGARRGPRPSPRDAADRAGDRLARRRRARRRSSIVSLRCATVRSCSPRTGRGRSRQRVPCHGGALMAGAPYGAVADRGARPRA